MGAQQLELGSYETLLKPSSRLERLAPACALSAPNFAQVQQVLCPWSCRPRCGKYLREKCFFPRQCPVRVKTTISSAFKSDLLPPPPPTQPNPAQIFRTASQEMTSPRSFTNLVGKMKETKATQETARMSLMKQRYEAEAAAAKAAHARELESLARAKDAQASALAQSMSPGRMSPTRQREYGSPGGGGALVPISNFASPYGGGQRADPSSVRKSPTSGYKLAQRPSATKSYGGGGADPNPTGFMSPVTYNRKVCGGGGNGHVALLLRPSTLSPNAPPPLPVHLPLPIAPPSSCSCSLSYSCLLLLLFAPVGTVQPAGVGHGGADAAGGGRGPPRATRPPRRRPRARGESYHHKSHAGAHPHKGHLQP